MEGVALDTSFLIDLQNERRARGRVRGAVAFLEAHRTTRLLLPAVALGEYLEGFDDPASEVAQALVAHLDILPVTEDVAQLYARTTRVLRSAGKLLGTNDLWIACTARAAGVPIVTRNMGHFRRVPQLGVLGYAT
jgi:tRNA(fMet)-specific endonuclease VapC